MKKNKKRSLGISDYLTLIFVALKLAGIGVVATWSWVWVLSPLWIGFLLNVAIQTTLSVIKHQTEIMKKDNDFKEKLNEIIEGLPVDEDGNIIIKD
jgi:small Trp-rich protein